MNDDRPCLRIDLRNPGGGNIEPQAPDQPSGADHERLCLLVRVAADFDDVADRQAAVEHDAEVSPTRKLVRRVHV